jgi:hypothetical protein
MELKSNVEISVLILLDGNNYDDYKINILATCHLDFAEIIPYPYGGG